MKFAVFSIGLFLASAAIAEEASAPFGLQWGASAEEVEKIVGASPDDKLLWGRVQSFDVALAPLTPPNTRTILLAVDPELGLGRIIWISEEISNDAFGSAGKRNFNEIKTILTEKYGNPESAMEKTGVTLWKDRDEFYQCLAHDGCGLWFALWKTVEPAMKISLKIQGVRRGEGFIVLTYEGPNWSEIVAKVNSSENKAKKDAF